jgi:hypothetical protein
MLEQSVQRSILTYHPREKCGQVELLERISRHALQDWLGYVMRANRKNKLLAWLCVPGKKTASAALQIE